MGLSRANSALRRLTCTPCVLCDYLDDVNDFVYFVISACCICMFVTALWEFGMCILLGPAGKFTELIGCVVNFIVY